MSDSGAKKERNALFEIYRFFFAMWVVYYHGYFFFKNSFFNHGYIAVEFFFILSGFFLIKSINKYLPLPFFKGFGKFSLKRLKDLGVTFGISIVFVIVYMLLEKEISLLGYMWYIPCMFLAFGVIFALRKYIKSDKAFILTLVAIVVVSYLVLYIPLLEGWGLFRALGGVCLGVLISYIKKLPDSLKPLSIAMTIIFIIITLSLAFMVKTNYTFEYILIFLAFPALVYFTNCVPVKNKTCTFLGSLSFGLYANQCIVRVIEWLTYPFIPQPVLFLILVALTFITRAMDHTLNFALKNDNEKIEG